MQLRFPYRRPRDVSRAESQQSDICPQKSRRRRFKFGSRITPAVTAFLSISHFEPPIPQPYVTCQIGVIGFPRFRYCIIRGNVCCAACMYSAGPEGTGSCDGFGFNGPANVNKRTRNTMNYCIESEKSDAFQRWTEKNEKKEGKEEEEAVKEELETTGIL